MTYSADEDKKAVAEDIVRKTMKKGGTTIDVERPNVGSKGRQRASPSVEEMAAWAWNVEHDMDEKCKYIFGSSYVYANLPSNIHFRFCDTQQF